MAPKKKAPKRKTAKKKAVKKTTKKKAIATKTKKVTQKNIVKRKITSKKTTLNTKKKAKKPITGKIKIKVPLKKTKPKALPKVSPKSIEKKIKGVVSKIKDTPKERKKVEKIDLAPEKKTTAAVLFDTNFLMIPGEFKLDIFAHAKHLMPRADLAIFDKTIYELQKITESGGNASTGKHAKMALQLINQQNLKIITTDDETYVDDMLVNYDKYLTEYTKIAVATQDKELKSRLQKKGIGVIYMASKKRLALNKAP